MNFDDIGRVWREEGTEEFRRTRIEDLSTVRGRAARLMNRARRLVLVDMVAALVAIPFFTYQAIRAPSALAALGAIIIVIMLIVIPIRLRVIRRAAPDPTLPVRVAVQAEVTRLRALERFHRTVEWYLVPVALGMILYLAGLSVDIVGDPVPVAFRIRMSILGVAAFGLVIFGNRVSLRLRVQPLREDLESWLTDLEESGLDGAQ